MADVRSPKNFRSLLADDRFRPVWLSGMLVGVFRWLEMLAIGVFTFQLTGSAVIVSLMTVMRMAPLFLFGMPFGMLADRVDRRTLLLVGLAVMTLCSAVLAILAAHDRLSLWHVGFSAFLNGMFWAGDFPIRRTMVGEIAGRERLGPAMALESSTSNATRMLGPALGGVILEGAGLAGVFATATLAYAVCAVWTWRLAYRSQAARPVDGLIATLVEGWSAVRANRMIMASLAITMIVNLWGFAYITLVPVIGERQLDLSPVMIGVLASTEGLGALIGAILVGILAKPAHYTRLYLYASALFLSTLIGIGLSSSPALSFTLMLVAGVTVSGFAVMQSTVTFLASEPETRSRVMGVLTVGIGTCPIGMLHVGLLADGFGAGTAVVIMAIEGLVALALVAALWPELRRATLLSGS